MAKNIEIMLLLTQSAMVLLVLEWVITPFALLPGTIAAFALGIRHRSAKKDAEVVVFAKDVLRNYRLGLIRSAEAAIKKGYSFSDEIRLQIRRFRLGDYHITAKVSGNAHLSELLSIMACSLSTGSSAKANIEGFCKRLEGSLNTRNRIASKIGGMQSVAFLGVSFFLPLFGGISSTILITSLGLVNQGSIVLQHDFIYDVASYILLVTVIGTFINRPTLPVIKNLSTIVRTFAISLLILISSATYITYAI